jgi:hypothetical protein
MYVKLDGGSTVVPFCQARILITETGPVLSSERIGFRLSHRLPRVQASIQLMRSGALESDVDLELFFSSDPETTSAREIWKRGGE